MSELLGPDISWHTGRQAEESGLTMACVDFDNHRKHGFDVIVDDSAYDDYPGNALNRAARAYRRAGGWDHSTPEDGGIWLLMLAPVGAIIGGDDSPWRYFGHLAGFVILYDRDEDDEYEAVGHAWTAAAWRRRGIARRLLEEARSRFQTATFEGPYTTDGAALVKAVQWPGAATP